MKKFTRIITALLIASLTAAFMCNSVFAFDEAEENALVQIG